MNVFIGRKSLKFFGVFHWMKTSNQNFNICAIDISLYQILVIPEFRKIMVYGM